jgi:hypothetical protein
MIPWISLVFFYDLHFFISNFINYDLFAAHFNQISQGFANLFYILKESVFVLLSLCMFFCLFVLVSLLLIFALIFTNGLLLLVWVQFVLVFLGV